MKYEIDLASQPAPGSDITVTYFPTPTSVRVQTVKYNPPVREPQNSWADTKGHMFYFEGVPLRTEPWFDSPDGLRISVGETWVTGDKYKVKVIARHSDGDFEVTVTEVNTYRRYHSLDERRGTRVGSSYIVDRNGRVKPGHLAPPADMHLVYAIPAIADTTVSTSATTGSMNGSVIPAPVPAPLHEQLGFRASVLKLVDEALALRLPAAVKLTDVTIAKALKAYDDAKVKLFVGKTYVTRNGSQVLLTRVGGEPSPSTIEGKIVRGGDKDNRWGAVLVTFLDGRADAAGGHPMDLIHEVLP